MLVIAKNSRRDTQLMLRIAQNSGAVAVSTAKDNAAMRVIAGVTIIFLPATFIAVSTTLHDAKTHHILLTTTKDLLIHALF